MPLERALCDLMNYKAAVLFPRARDALAAWCRITGKKIKIPTNCCDALLPFASELVPVDPYTGLAPVPVQLYGYRQEFEDCEIEIDPLMTGMFGKPFATSSVVSFGYSKTVDIGGGGAILTSDASLAKELQKFGFFPKVLFTPLQDTLARIHSIVMEKKSQYEQAEDEFAPFVERLKDRPVVPWRFVARASQPGFIATTARQRGWKISQNYRPLPGVVSTFAIEWGRKVVNVWR